MSKNPEGIKPSAAQGRWLPADYHGIHQMGADRYRSRPAVRPQAEYNLTPFRGKRPLLSNGVTGKSGKRESENRETEPRAEGQAEKVKKLKS